MSIAKQLAKHLRDVYFGGNWTTTDLKTTLADVSWQDATRSVYGLNSIAVLTFHVAYFVDVLNKVLEEGILDGKDEHSFRVPPIGSQEDWKKLQERIWMAAEKAAGLIEQLPDEQLPEGFIDPKYGTYYRNIAGIIEHLHYHLGQIVIIKKILAQ